MLLLVGDRISGDFYIFSILESLYCGNKIIIITGNYDQREIRAKIKGSLLYGAEACF